ncbi:MAG TPA: GNAT family N-acetyltransferase [Candidatus Polarisedimenticolaceae bacterium]|nr:GNAT family N-acetyltransferase [Candidatus Polarisedimenticolaceae bacterium]
MRQKVVTSYFEMTGREQLRPARPATGLSVLRAGTPCPELNRFLYTGVGGDWYWIDRLSWSHERWMEWLGREEVETWVGYREGNPVGYFELERQAAGDLELAYFGLLPQFIGRGLGGPLLTRAIERGFEAGARRVWVHTCSLDHPAARNNYLARGFRLYREEEEWKDLPEASPGPWPGARPS